MNADELVTRADLEAVKEEIIAAIKAMVNPDAGTPYSFEEACKFLKMEAQTLRQKCSSGEIAYSKAGGVKFQRKDLIAYLNAHRRKSNAEILATAMKR